MSGGSKKKAGSKKIGSTKSGTHSNFGNSNNSSNGNESNNDSNPFVRPATNHSINPRSILTGFYQKNGKRVQHTVHDGALQMPKDAVDVIETATSKFTNGMVQSFREYDLPGLDSVVRPCLDTELEKITVTELVMEKVQIPQEQPAVTVAITSSSATGLGGAAIVPPVGATAVKLIKTSRPTAKNRRIRRMLSSAIKQQAGTSGERIRGGGDVPTTEGQQPQQKDPEAGVSMHVDHAAIALAEPPIALQKAQTSGVQTVSSFHCDTINAANDVGMAQEPPLSEDKTSAVDTEVDTEVATSTTTLESNPDISKDPHTSGEEYSRVQNKCTASTKQSPVTDATTAADFFSSPKNAVQSTQDIHISKTPALEWYIPPSVDPSGSVTDSGLASKETGAEIKPPISPNNEIMQQQQFTPLEMPTIAIASASTNTLSPEKGNTVTGNSRTEGNSVVDENSLPSNSNEIKSEVLAQAPMNIQSSNASTREANEYPTTAVAQVVAVPTGTADSSFASTAIIDTSNETTENVVLSSVVGNLSSAVQSGVATAGTDEPTSTPTVPVLTSSTPVVDVRPAATQVKEEKKPEENVLQARALTSKPSPQWEQHKPGLNDETITPENQLPPKPEWYKKENINEIERTMLPEWFDSSSPHRTPESYIKAREKVIEMSEALSNRNVTNAMIRRSILGDAGSLQRLRSFLVNWGIVNRDGINDSAPTTASLRPDLKKSAKLTEEMRDALILAVTEQATKKRKLSSSSSLMSSLSLDWEKVACQVGYGVSAEICRENFMTFPLKAEPSNAMDSTEDFLASPVAASLEGVKLNQHYDKSQEKLIHNLLGNSNPGVLKKVCDAAIAATNFNCVETQAASLLGIHVTQTIENARGHELDLALQLSKLLDVRMQKLENRMAMLDDVEGILEAEKVALEMERRDLYTARCRHWFGGV